MTVYESLDAFFAATAWKMVTPPSYGVFHLAFFFVGLALSIFFAWKLRNLGEKGTRSLLLSIGIFLVAAEIYKQLFYFF